ncbi:hypothetical protein ANANG_G00259590 [Anguilla anguilla]|uniref:Fibroblast growth factor n=1 Tax=Anguilla anguilla TaxID=7936 RepID=A0A9D3RNN8_ANGAN|nr:hypothetical protein ANANG_G00259590 [Anguilla anguilla]
MHVLVRMRFPCWCFLFARLFIFAAVTTSDHVSLGDQLLEEGINSGRRTGRLYCRVGIGFHLQIHPDGRVNGSHEPNQLSLLELFAISQGVVGIRGALSRRFLSMNKRGRLHAVEPPEWEGVVCSSEQEGQGQNGLQSPREIPACLHALSAQVQPAGEVPVGFHHHGREQRGPKFPPACSTKSPSANGQGGQWTKAHSTSKILAQI